MKAEHCADCCRSAMAQFLLSEGQSNTWLLGSRLITVTTSGCSQKPLKNGLCDKCYHTCRLEKGNANYLFTKHERKRGRVDQPFRDQHFPSSFRYKKCREEKVRTVAQQKYLKNTNIVHVKRFISF